MPGKPGIAFIEFENKLQVSEQYELSKAFLDPSLVVFFS